MTETGNHNDRGRTTNVTTDRKLRTFQRDVLITLTNEERHTRGAMLADKLRELSETRENFKKVQREWSNKIKDADKEVDRIADAVRDGKETRQVLCYEIVVGNTVETRRVDTDELVAAPRPAEAREAQEPLPGTTPPGVGILDDVPTTAMPAGEQRAQASLGIVNEDGDIIPAEGEGKPRKGKKATE